MEGQFLPRDGGGWPQGVNRIIIATNFFKFSRFKKGKRGKPGPGGGGGGLPASANAWYIDKHFHVFPLERKGLQRPGEGVAAGSNGGTRGPRQTSFPAAKRSTGGRDEGVSE